MKLIVGLGNPGNLYSNTRHNIGFMAVDKIVLSMGLEFDKLKFGGLYTSINIKGEKIIFLKPQEYINLSGVVIKKYIDYFKIEVNDIFVISDDLDLSVGRIKLKSSGSSGGHNGLKNIELHLGTKDYKRLKIGISNNKLIDTKDYVLSKINIEDMSIIEKVIELSPQIFVDFLNMSFSDLMTKYNKKI